MKKTKRISNTAIFTAMYFVLSAMLKIPVAGHITVDLGYIALTVAAVYLGPVCAMFVGGIGALLESTLMSHKGISLGWIAMNIIIGYLCGLVMHKTASKSNKELIVSSLIIIPTSVLLGVAVKTLIDCALYNLTIVAKLPTSFASWAIDSLVMLAIGLPLSIALKKYNL